ncbi:hypothetical protein Vafri_14912, partial [Volvox africanus]
SGYALHLFNRRLPFFWWGRLEKAVVGNGWQQAVGISAGDAGISCTSSWNSYQPICKTNVRPDNCNLMYAICAGNYPHPPVVVANERCNRSNTVAWALLLCSNVEVVPACLCCCVGLGGFASTVATTTWHDAYLPPDVLQSTFIRSPPREVDFSKISDFSR